MSENRPENRAGIRECDCRRVIDDVIQHAPELIRRMITWIADRELEDEDTCGHEQKRNGTA